MNVRKSSVQYRAEQLSREGIFTGGPVTYFELVGRNQLITLLNNGLSPQHKVLDVGCGCLRAGYWIIHFLRSGNYFGIEPNKEMLQAGLKSILESEIVAEKQPRFDHNSFFDFSIFGTTFDFVLARSIWTHAAPAQILKMLDQFLQYTNEDAEFFTSYIRATADRPQNKNSDWVGRSHKSNIPGMVTYDFEWIESECRQRGLQVVESGGDVLNQTWLRVRRSLV